ncbi:MAG: hypothetical protein QOJ65_754 [Fimbriimonadaceae bacterium]|nr:hypothetical protein [Fimbriimonadaceae bacterium]
MQTIEKPVEQANAAVSVETTRIGRRVEFIDAVRGIAALLVMLEHYSEYWFAPFTVEAAKYVNLGRLGVISFFLVSGFVIPMSIERKDDLRAFWISRVCRLYPAYWAGLIFLVLTATVTALAGNPTLQQDLSAVSVKRWISNVLMVQLFAGDKDIIKVAWTLGLEWIIYISASVLHARGLLKRTPLLYWITVNLIILGALAVPLVLNRRVPFAAVSALTSAIAGLALFRLWKNELTAKKAWMMVGSILALVLVGSWVNYGLFPARTETNLTITPMSAMTSTALGYALFIVPFLRPAWSYPAILTSLGRLSYSLYLFHDIAPRPTFLTGAAGFFFQIAEALVLAYLCYRFVEVPGIALGKRWIARGSTKAAGPSVPEKPQVSSVV